MKYLVICKGYTDVGGIKLLYHVCPPVPKIIHVQAYNPWYSYYIAMTPGKLHINDVLITSLNFEGIPKIFTPLFQHIVGVHLV